MLHDQLKIKFSVLRAYYEKLDCDAGNLVAVLHAKYEWFHSDHNHIASTQYFHCALAAAQCIVIGPVCLWVSLLPR